MHDILVVFWESLVSFVVGKDISHRTCWQLRIQVNHGNLRVAALHFSSGGSQKIYLRNSLRNPLQVPCNEFQIPLLFLANIYLTPVDFVGPMLSFQRDGDRALISSTWGDISFKFVLC
jgi:hypothetical protein